MEICLLRGKGRRGEYEQKHSVKKFQSYLLAFQHIIISVLQFSKRQGFMDVWMFA